MTHNGLASAVFLEALCCAERYQQKLPWRKAGKAGLRVGLDFECGRILGPRLGWACRGSGTLKPREVASSILCWRFVDLVTANP